MTHFFRAFRHRNYQLFFSGQLSRSPAPGCSRWPQAWLVYRLTGSAACSGVAAFASQIPVLAVRRHRRRRGRPLRSPPDHGDHADRLDGAAVRPRGADASPARCACGTCSGPRGVLWAVVNAFDIPARQAFVVDMVGREDLVNAIALNSSMFNGARVIGSGVAGVLVARVGEGWCFLLNGVSYLAVIAGLLMMRGLPKRPRRAHSIRPATTARGLPLRRARTAPVRALLLLLGLVSLTGMPYAVLMPVFADQILHGGARGLGLLMGASGLGALGGALSLASGPVPRPRAVGRDGGGRLRRGARAVLAVAHLLAVGRCCSCRSAAR